MHATVEYHGLHGHRFNVTIIEWRHKLVHTLWTGKSAMKTSINPQVPLTNVYSLFVWVARYSYSSVVWKYGVYMLDGSALIYVALECFRVCCRRLLPFISCLSVSNHKALLVLNLFISILWSIRFQCRRQQSLIVFHVVRGSKRFLFIPWCYVPAFDPLFYLQAHLTSSGEIENEKWRYSLPVCDITGLPNKRQNKFFEYASLVFI